MTDNVIGFRPEIVGEGFRLNPDEMLENTKGNGLKKLCIIGETEDGELYIAGSDNLGETLMLLLRLQHKIARGDYG